MTEEIKEKPEKSQYAGYKVKKGETPPWDPFNPEKRKKRITIREKKFLLMLSTTGSLQEAYRSAYKVTPMSDKKLEGARVTAMANQVLARLKKKSPELTAKMTFEDITPDFVRKGLLDLYGRSKEKGDMTVEKGVLELMGKLYAMFTEKHQVDNKIKGVVENIYKESDDDFPRKDERINRLDIENQLHDIPKA